MVAGRERERDPLEVGIREINMKLGNERKTRVGMGGGNARYR